MALGFLILLNSFKPLLPTTSANHIHFAFAVSCVLLLTAFTESISFVGRDEPFQDQLFHTHLEQRLPPGLDLGQPRRSTPTLPPGLPIPPGFQPPPVESEDERQLEQRQPVPPALPSMAAPTSSHQVKRAATDRKAALPVVKQSTASGTESVVLKQVDKPTPSKVIPVVPVLPERAATPKKQISESVTPTVSLGGPSSQVVTPSDREDLKSQIPQSLTASDAVPRQFSESKTLEDDSRNDSDAKVSTKAGSKRPHPGKIDISKAILMPEKDIPSSTTSAGPPKSEVLARRRAPSLTSSASSRPGTPAAVATGSPIRRTSTLARTLRITGTPSEVTPTTTAQPTSTPVAASASKVSSRRPSVSSLNAPGTPGSEYVDSTSLASASVSRANSPPPLTTNKKAEKKARKQKQKQAQTEVEALPIKEPTEEQAPILSRKKKTKKPGDGPTTKRTATSSSTPQVSRPPSPKLEENDEDIENVISAEPEQLDDDVETPTEKIPEPPATASEPEPSQPSASTTEKENDKPLTAAAILRALESTHQLALSTLSLLKPLTETKPRNWLTDPTPSSTTAHPSSTTLPFTTADLHNHLDQLALELTRAEAELLRRGTPLRRAPPDGRLSGRALVTPDGRRFACLSGPEEDRAVALAAADAAAKGPARWRPAKTPAAAAAAAAPRDAPKAGGVPARADDVAAGVNAFVPPGVDGPGGGAAAEAGSAEPGARVERRAEDVAQGRGGEGALGAYAGIGAGYAALGVPLAKEKMSVKEAEALLGEARKAAEMWERKLNAVVKKNRKLVFGGRE